MFSFQGSLPQDKKFEQSQQTKFLEIIGHHSNQFYAEKAAVVFNTDHPQHFGFIIPEIVAKNKKPLLEIFNKCLLRYNPLFFLNEVEQIGPPSTEEGKEVIITKLEYFKAMALNNADESNRDATNNILDDLEHLLGQIKIKFDELAEDQYEDHWKVFIGQDNNSGLRNTLIKLQGILKP